MIAYTLGRGRDLARALNFDRDLDLALALARGLALNYDLDLDLDDKIQVYLIAKRLLVDCLKLAYVSDREAIENSLLLPPKKTNPEPKIIDANQTGTSQV
jgi:hypothetical protein